MSKNNLPKEINIDLSKAESYFRGGGMTIINHNFHFLQDKNYMKIHQNLAMDNKEEKRIWKNHIYCSFFENGLHLDGDLIECGVYRGFASAVACNYLKFNEFKNKKLFLFDTWDGIPDDQLDNIRKKYPEMNNKYKSEENLQIVNKRFKNFNNVIKVIGKIPDSFNKIDIPKKISLMRILAELIISTLFFICGLKFIRNLIVFIPIKILGPFFNYLRIIWKTFSKGIKRKGLNSYKILLK